MIEIRINNSVVELFDEECEHNIILDGDINFKVFQWKIIRNTLGLETSFINQDNIIKCLCEIIINSDKEKEELYNNVAKYFNIKRN